MTVREIKKAEKNSVIDISTAVCIIAYSVESNDDAYLDKIEPTILLKALKLYVMNNEES